MKKRLGNKKNLVAWFGCRIGCWAGCCVVCLAGWSAQAKTIRVHFDPAQSQVRWILPTTLHTVHGTFALKSGEITFEDTTGAATGLFVVEADTGQSGDSLRDHRMKNSILKTMEYPTAEFHPTHVTGTLQASGTSTVVVQGRFHLYGADHPLEIALQVNVEGKNVTAVGKFEVPYVAWGMHDPSTLFLRVEKSVQVEMDAKGSRIP